MTVAVEAGATAVNVARHVIRGGSAPSVDGRWRPRVLLLHGLANNASVWGPLLDRAAEPAGGSPIDWWTADLPWRGDGPIGWSHGGDLRIALAEALRRVPDGPTVVVAHSFSANLLMQMLSDGVDGGLDPFARYGIRGLVLVAPFYRRRPEEFGWDTTTASHENFVDLMEEGIRVRLRRPTGPELVRDMAKRVADRVGAYGWVRFMEVYLRTPWLRLDAFTRPVLVVAGAADRTRAEAEALAGRLPRGQLRIAPDSGHFPMIERADWFAAAVRGFAGSVRPAAPPDRAGSGTDGSVNSGRAA